MSSVRTGNGCGAAGASTSPRLPPPSAAIEPSGKVDESTGNQYSGRVEYEWDATKAAENLRRHGIDFVDSIAAIEDANRPEELDSRLEYGEKRLRIIGMAAGDVLFVVTTLRGERTCRIISARRATRHEQDRYYAGDRETW
jgi:uncharacterized DUF497 family protein